MKSSVERTALRAIHTGQVIKTYRYQEIGTCRPTVSNPSQLPCPLEEGYLLTVILLPHSISSH